MPEVFVREHLLSDLLSRILLIGGQSHLKIIFIFSFHVSVALPWKLEVKNKHLKLRYDTGKTIITQSEMSENFIWLYNV